MQESVIYQDILRKGEQRGEQRGRQEGRQEEGRSLVLRLLPANLENCRKSCDGPLGPVSDHRESSSYL